MRFLFPVFILAIYTRVGESCKTPGNSIQCVPGSHRAYIGKCVDNSEKDINQGETDLGHKSNKEACLAACKGSGWSPTGCEYSSHNAFGGKCTMHSQEIASGNGEEDSFCAIISEGESCNTNSAALASPSPHMATPRLASLKENPIRCVPGSHREYRGKCATDGEAVNQGKQYLGTQNSTDECLARCRQESFFALGCEYNNQETEKHCTLHKSYINSGTGDNENTCMVYLDLGESCNSNSNPAPLVQTPEFPPQAQNEWITSGDPTSWTWPSITESPTSKCSHKGKCTDESNQEIQEEKQDLGGNKFSKEKCMAACKTSPWASACEYNDPHRTCTMHNSLHVASGNGDNDYICQLLQGSCKESAHVPAQMKESACSAKEVKQFLEPPKWPGKEQECVTDKENKACQGEDYGRNYKGDVSKTRGDLDCQRWDTCEPHYHGFTNEGKHNKWDNKCRNPYVNKRGPVRTGVWCFTTDPKVRWDFCNVPKCCEKPSSLKQVDEWDEWYGENSSATLEEPKTKDGWDGWYTDDSNEKLEEPKTNDEWYSDDSNEKPQELKTDDGWDEWQTDNSNEKPQDPKTNDELDAWYTDTDSSIAKIQEPKTNDGWDGWDTDDGNAKLKDPNTNDGWDEW